jgi:F-type H+-transporting ATPase subunit b
VEFDASLLVMMGIFGVVYTILRIFLFRPLLRVIKVRESRIADAQQTYESAVADAESKMEAERAKLTAARRGAGDHRDALRRDAQQSRRQSLEEAKLVADEKIQSVRDELAEQVRVERAKLEAQVDHLANEIASRVLGRAV